MRFLKRDNSYRSSSGKCTFDPIAMTAWSYSWWQFVAYIDGAVWFNCYHYSMPTDCHQRAVRKLLADHGIKCRYVSYAAGLQNISGQITIFEREIEHIQAAIAKPRSHKKKNAWRLERIAFIRANIKLARRLMRLKRKPYPGKLKNFPPVPPKPTPEELQRRKKRRERLAAQRQAREAYAVAREVAGQHSNAINSGRLFAAVDGGASFSRVSKATLSLVRGGAQ